MQPSRSLLEYVLYYLNAENEDKKIGRCLYFHQVVVVLKYKSSGPTPKLFSAFEHFKHSVAYIIPATSLQTERSGLVRDQCPIQIQSNRVGIRDFYSGFTEFIGGSLNQIIWTCTSRSDDSIRLDHDCEPFRWTLAPLFVVTYR